VFRQIGQDARDESAAPTRSAGRCPDRRRRGAAAGHRRRGRARAATAARAAAAPAPLALAAAAARARDRRSRRRLAADARQRRQGRVDRQRAERRAAQPACGRPAAAGERVVRPRDHPHEHGRPRHGGRPEPPAGRRPRSPLDRDADRLGGADRCGTGRRRPARGRGRQRAAREGLPGRVRDRRLKQAVRDSDRREPAAGGRRWRRARRSRSASRVAS